MMTAINALIDRLLTWLVPLGTVTAACPTERYYVKCYCNPSDALVYYRWCTVLSSCAVKCGACFGSQYRCL